MDKRLETSEYSETPSMQDGTIADSSGVVAETPFLAQWKTNVGMFLLGLLASGALNALVARIDHIVVFAVSAAYLLTVFIYALWIYPTLFTSRPKLKSSLAATFMNSFCGGLIFGALWCTCLTKKRKGMSQYVLTALLAMGFVIILLIGFGAIPGTNLSELNRSQQSQSTTNSGGYTRQEEQDFLSNPTKHLNTDGAIRRINEGKTGDWSKASKSLQRLTFGNFDAGTDSFLWSCGCSNPSNFLDGELAYDEAVEITIVAFSQIFDSFEKGAYATERLLDIYILGEALSPAYEGYGYYGPVNFELDGKSCHYQILWHTDDSQTERYVVLLGGDL